MAIPIIPIVAVLGAGTLGYFIGRETAPCPASRAPASLPWSGDEDGDEHEYEYEYEHEDEETSTAPPAPGNEGGEAEREAATDSAWASMSRAEALEVLELGPEATPDAIREAHRRIARRIRPDKGGSRYLAAAVDRAKIVLLG